METLFTWRRWHSFLSLREAGRSTCSTSIYLRHRADFTPVPTLCSRLIICILYMDKTRLWKRDLPKVTWLMRSGARVTSRSSDPNVADLLQSPGTIVWEQGKLIGQERGCSVGERKSSHTWCWERTQKQAEEKGRDCCKDPAPVLSENAPAPTHIHFLPPSHCLWCPCCHRQVPWHFRLSWLSSSLLLGNEMKVETEVETETEIRP